MSNIPIKLNMRNS